MTKTSRIILVAASVILLCSVIIAGATFALFSESKEITVHLQAGKLDVEFYRDGYSYTVLQDDGTLKTVTGGTRVDFTKPVNENIFGFAGSENEKFKIVPGSSFGADLQLVNKGSTAFTYDIDIVYNGNSDALASQLLVTVGEYHYDQNQKRVETVKKSARLNDPTWKTAEGFLDGTLNLGTEAVSSNMFVRIDFVSDSNGTNNNVMSDSVYFDLVLTCVQHVGNNS